MAIISKHDKDEWDNYISNFDKYALFPKNNTYINKKSNYKFAIKDNKFSNNSKNLNKKKLEPDVILDLHGQTLYSSRLLLHKVISNCYEKNIRNLLIITGKGKNNKGALKCEVPKWLGDKIFNKFLVSFNIAPKHSGGDGALLVRIKNRFKNINN